MSEEIRIRIKGGDAATGDGTGEPGFVEIELPDGSFIAIDATCPACGFPERRVARFDEHGPIFSCRQCPHVSRWRNA